MSYHLLRHADVIDRGSTCKDWSYLIAKKAYDAAGRETYQQSITNSKNSMTIESQTTPCGTRSIS